MTPKFSFIAKICSILLATALIFTGCATAADPTEAPTSAPTGAPTEAPTETPTEAPTETPTEESVESPVAYAHPLTGKPLDAPLTGRVFAASVNNAKAAMPQHGISQADMYYEMLVEGSVTRCLGIFTDMGAVEKLGPVRSARMYTLDLARYFNAILVRAGGSSEADNAVKDLDWDELNGLYGYANSAFYRDEQRRSNGYAYEHTLFAGGPELVSLARARELPLELEEPLDYGLQFTKDATPADGEAATSITMAFGSGKNAKRTGMTYSSEIEQYEASQFGSDWIDGNTGLILAFENVLILRAETWVQEDDVHKTIELTGTGDGYFACGGKIVPIRWSRDSDTAPFVYTLTDGTALTLGIGRSFVGIIPTNGIVEYQ